MNTLENYIQNITNELYIPGRDVFFNIPITKTIDTRPTNTGPSTSIADGQSGTKLIKTNETLLDPPAKRTIKEAILPKLAIKLASKSRLVVKRINIDRKTLIPTLHSPELIFYVEAEFKDGFLANPQKQYCLLCIGEQIVLVENKKLVFCEKFTHTTEVSSITVSKNMSFYVHWKKSYGGVFKISSDLDGLVNAMTINLQSSHPAALVSVLWFGLDLEGQPPSAHISTENYASVKKFCVYVG